MMTDTTSLTIKIDADIDLELERHAIATGHTKPEVVRDVLAEWLQDQDDYRDAVAITVRKELSSGSAEVRRRLGLED